MITNNEAYIVVSDELSCLVTMFHGRSLVCTVCTLEVVEQLEQSNKCPVLPTW